MSLLESDQEGLTGSDRDLSALLDVQLRQQLTTRVRITVNTRSTDWSQVRADPIGSLELHAHMRAIALAEWKRRNGQRTVVVTARDVVSGEVIETVQGQLIPACPRCGFDRS